MKGNKMPSNKKRITEESVDSELEQEEKDVLANEVADEGEEINEADLAPEDKMPLKPVKPTVNVRTPYLSYDQFEEVRNYQGKAKAMKEHLAKQPKVVTMIPLEVGEPQGTVAPIVMNGYQLNIKKGVFVEVPQQVAELIAESFRLTYEAGQNYLIDRDEKIRNALS